MTESEEPEAELWEVKVLVWTLFSWGDEIWGDSVMEGLILNKEASEHTVGTPRNHQNLKLGSGYTHPP